MSPSRVSCTVVTTTQLRSVVRSDTVASPSDGMGTIIRERREALGLSQPELAAALDVKQQVVSRWETGASNPKLHHLVALAHRLEVTTDTLLGRTGTPPTASVEAALRADTSISDESRAALLAAYRAARSLPG